MEKIAIIGSGYMARIIANRAKELGIETHSFSNDSNGVVVPTTDYFHNVSIFDTNKIIDICRSANVKGIIATTELTILPAAIVAKELSLNTNTIEVAKRITNKIEIRQLLTTCKVVKQPQFKLCTSEDDPIDIELPVVVKPIAAGGKRGVSVVYDQELLKEAIKKAIDCSNVKGALIEQYIMNGKEFSVETLSYHGQHYLIQITEKDTSGPPRCVELGHHQPANISTEIWTKIEASVKEALTKAGIKEGPCCTEIIVKEGDAYLVEINGRLGGDHIAYPLTELSTGYPYITGVIQASLNILNEKDIEIKNNGYAGVHFVTKDTAQYKRVFDSCECEDWLYEKNEVTKDLKEITHNDCFNTNYFIYYSKKERPIF